MKSWRMRWWQQTLLALAVILLVHSQFSANPLPDFKPHPLPGSLASWEDREGAGDYFDRIESTQMGYLIWSEFPIKVYLDIARSSYAQNTASDLRFEQWLATVRKAIGEWNVYLPLVETDNPRLADITVVRLLPKREIKLNPETGLYNIPRAIAATTDYRFFLREETGTVAHKITVTISPNFLGESLLATVRHELGHALGIWGHSLEVTDALYYSQVREPMPISSRDVNTLKKIYQQPTRLGWKSEK